MAYVVASRPDGLGTRLLTILAGRHLAESLGVELKVTWPSINDAMFVDQDILQEDTAADIFHGGRVFSDDTGAGGEILDHASLEGKNLFRVHNNFASLSQIDIEEFRRITEQYDVILYDTPNVLNLSHEDKDDEQNKIRAYARQFAFNHEVMARFEQIAVDFSLDKAVAVHVRRGDMAEVLFKRDLDFLKAVGITQLFQRYIPLQTTFDMIHDKFKDKETLVLCTEDIAVVPLFRREFPEKRVLCTSDEYPDNKNKQALIDILVMSRAQDLITPFVSYFSECSAAMGVCRRHSVGLDCYNLVNELMALIDGSDSAIKATLKALVLTVAWQNLWPEPASPKKDILLEMARQYDRQLADELLGGQP